MCSTAQNSPLCMKLAECISDVFCLSLPLAGFGPGEASGGGGRCRAG